MYIPIFDEYHTMKRNILTAITLCGEIDGDGQVDVYGEEVPSDGNLSDDVYDENADRDSEA